MDSKPDCRGAFSSELAGEIQRAIDRIAETLVYVRTTNTRELLDLIQWLRKTSRSAAAGSEPAAAAVAEVSARVLERLLPVSLHGCTTSVADAGRRRLPGARAPRFEKWHKETIRRLMERELENLGSPSRAEA